MQYQVSVLKSAATEYHRLWVESAACFHRS